MRNKITSIVELKQNEINIVSGNNLPAYLGQAFVVGTLLTTVALISDEAALKKIIYNGFATGIGFSYAQTGTFNPQDLMKKITAGIIASSLKEIFDKTPNFADALFGSLIIFLFIQKYS